MLKGIRRGVAAFTALLLLIPAAGAPPAHAVGEPLTGTGATASG